jgi:hypothetical protein
MSENFREGSRIQQVYKKFHADGFDAALNLGLELGCKSTTLNSWIRSWARKLAAGGNTETTETGKEKKLPKLPKFERAINTPGNTIGKKRFHLSYWPEMTGVILVAGPDQSEIRFDQTNLGNQNAFPNEYLIIEEEEPNAKRRSKRAKR